MSNSVTVTNAIAQIRSEADIEEPEATSIATDAQLLVWLNKGYRALFELLADEVGLEYFGVSASVGPSSWAVPSDFYRPLGIDVVVSSTSDGSKRPAYPYNFGERLDNDGITGITPKYRIIAGTIDWKPASSTPTTAVTLWYVPLPTDMASNGSFNAFNGWDDYVVQYVVRRVKMKQEYDTSAVDATLVDLEAKIRKAAGKLRTYPITVTDVENRSGFWFYNG